MITVNGQNSARLNVHWFVTDSGASDVGSGSSHVYPVRHRCVPGANNLHEEFGCQPARQEE